MDKAFYKVHEACYVLACGRSQLYRWLASGELEHVKLGRSTRIAASALKDFIELRTQAGHEAEGALPGEAVSGDDEKRKPRTKRGLEA